MALARQPSSYIADVDNRWLAGCKTMVSGDYLRLYFTPFPSIYSRHTAFNPQSACGLPVGQQLLLADYGPRWFEVGDFEHRQLSRKKAPTMPPCVTKLIHRF